MDAVAHDDVIPQLAEHLRHKDGATFQAETEMIPLTCGGHIVAYHFMRRVGD